MKRTPALFFVLFLVLILKNTAVAQMSEKDRQSVKAAEIRNMINGVRYIFKPTYVTPNSGTGTTLTAEYTLKVSKDTIIAHLPYYGKSYETVNTTDQGISFTCTAFKYVIKEDKMGSWDITIKPTARGVLNLTDVRQLKLSISPSGFATLDVRSYNRQPISYSGYIEIPKNN